MKVLPWTESLRAIMRRAWSLYRRGVQSLSLSLRLAWRIHKLQISEQDVLKMLRPRR